MQKSGRTHFWKNAVSGIYFHQLEDLSMKQFLLISAVFLAVLFVSVQGCSPAPQKAPPKETTGEYFDDSYITTKVKAAILNERTLKSAEINVETFKGVVQLSGFVNSRSDIHRAIEVARSVKGVKSVKNDMRLK
jgi:hyperosmotically inducible protein